MVQSLLSTRFPQSKTIKLCQLWFWLIRRCLSWVSSLQVLMHCTCGSMVYASSSPQNLQHTLYLDIPSQVGPLSSLHDTLLKYSQQAAFFLELHSATELELELELLPTPFFTLRPQDHELHMRRLIDFALLPSTTATSIDESTT